MNIYSVITNMIIRETMWSYRPYARTHSAECSDNDDDDVFMVLSRWGWWKSQHWSPTCLSERRCDHIGHTRRTHSADCSNVFILIDHPKKNNHCNEFDGRDLSGRPSCWAAMISTILRALLSLFIIITITMVVMLVWLLVKKARTWVPPHYRDQLSRSCSTRSSCAPTREPSILS